MSYKIVIDSCGELPERCIKDPHFENIPLTLDVDGHNIVDDETFDQKAFLKEVADSPNCPKSACPSPESFLHSCECEAEHVYIITLSANLSGSYNSAELGKKLYMEEHHEDKKIGIVDSCSASVGETLIGLKIEECEKQGMSFEDTMAAALKFRDEMNTYFVLESLETLRKNGRLSNLKAFVANALNIKPIMGATNEGQIKQISQARGINRAVLRMAKEVADNLKDPKNKVVAISYCNCPKRAETLKEEILKLVDVKDVMMLETRGISSLYANDGGVIVCV